MASAMKRAGEEGGRRRGGEEGRGGPSLQNDDGDLAQHVSVASLLRRRRADLLAVAIHLLIFF